MSEAKFKPIPLPLRRKSSARLAAAQCLYEIGVTGETLKPEKLYNDYVTRLEEGVAAEDKEVTPDPLPDLDHLKLLLHGVGVDIERIDAMLNKHLLAEWSRERMSPLMIAILRCAIYELMHQPKLPTNAAINEYVTLAASFFSEAELGFVNAFLQNVAKEVRP